MDAYVVTSHSHQAAQYIYNAACKQSLIVHQSMCPADDIMFMKTCNNLRRNNIVQRCNGRNV